MIKGLGNDIIEISRIKGVISRNGSRFLDRVFTNKEQNYCKQFKESERHFAGRFAAKEAIVKALGTGLREGLHWTDIEILNDSNGKPIATLHGPLKEKLSDTQVLVSISHCKKFAAAVAVIT